MNKIKVGFALCGSFCSFGKSLVQMENLIKDGYEILPIMSFNAFELDTRFGKASDFSEKIEKLTGKKIIHSLVEAESIGPKSLVDILLVSPCTGSTLGKICNAISDTPVSLAVKSQLRIQRPVVIALATNDALGASATNFGNVLNRKNIYFVPVFQDDPENKPTSLVAKFELIPQTLELALKGKQIQPIFI